MKTVVLGSFFLIASGMQAPAPKAGPDQKKLEPYIGKWKVDGEAKASPYGPAAKFSTTDTTEWLPGGFFFIHRFTGTQGSVAINAMEIVGYDARRRVYTSQTFDSYGNSGSWTGTASGDTWTWSGESETGGKHLKERCKVIFSERSTVYTVNCEWSEAGDTWSLNFVARGVRTK